MTDRDQNVACVMQVHDIWSTGQLERIADVYASDYVGHMPRGWDESEFHGHTGAKRALSRIREGFPDWREQVLDVVADQDRVVTRYLSTGTHTGVFGLFPPTGRTVEVMEISIYRLSNARVAEQRCPVDDLLFAQQLDLLPRR